MSLEEKVKKTKNLKERIRLCAILAKANGHSIPTIASILNISERSVYEYLSEYEKEQKTTDKIYPGKKAKLSESQEKDLMEYIKNFPAFSLKELGSYITTKYGITYTLSGLSNWLKRKKMTKKGTFSKRRIIDT